MRWTISQRIGNGTSWGDTIWRLEAHSEVDGLDADREGGYVCLEKNKNWMATNHLLYSRMLFSLNDWQHMPLPMSNYAIMRVWKHLAYFEDGRDTLLVIN